MRSTLGRSARAKPRRRPQLRRKARERLERVGGPAIVPVPFVLDENLALVAMFRRLPHAPGQTNFGGCPRLRTARSKLSNQRTNLSALAKVFLIPPFSIQGSDSEPGVLLAKQRPKVPAALREPLAKPPLEPDR